MAELDHRVKNTIANIQALVIQTRRNAHSLTGFVKELEGRIQAMAKAHSLLPQSRWEGVSIDRLLREELNHYANGHRAVSLDGTDMLLTPKSALSLSLAVHELATYAAKYGAFTAPGGHVAVGWRRTSNGSVELSWTETGGPLVEPRKRRGFCSTLIERALAMETGGHATVHYRPTGVVCDIFLPASPVTYSDVIALGGPTSQTDGGGMAEMPAAAAETFRILVVEDSLLLVMAIKAVLEDLGWVAVGPATRRAEALALAQSEIFDAALLDGKRRGADAADLI